MSKQEQERQARRTMAMEMQARMVLELMERQEGLEQQHDAARQDREER